MLNLIDLKNWQSTLQKVDKYREWHIHRYICIVARGYRCMYLYIRARAYASGDWLGKFRKNERRVFGSLAANNGHVNERILHDRCIESR